MKKYPKKEVVESEPRDLVYEGINKQKAAHKELRAKRQAGKDKKKLGGKAFKGRYS